MLKGELHRLWTHIGTWGSRCGEAWKVLCYLGEWKYLL